MHFTFTADTDVGTTKKINQDSVLIKHAKYSGGEILMAIICDGMGGLSKGELASAIVIKEFKKWFDEKLAYELEHINMDVIGGKWSLMLQDLNVKIFEYSRKNNITMGTTFTGALFVGDKYVIAHVGDTRMYHIDEHMKQLTEDQTYVAREIKRKAMTPEQAKKDKKRNMLLQCVGASQDLKPEIISAKQEKGAYMLCSDGFRHEISENEIHKYLNPKKLVSKKNMHSNTKYLIELNKQRNEKDNISVILIKMD